MLEIHLVVYDATYRPHIQHIREKVFISEQAVAPELEFDGLDEQALQLLLAVDNHYVGTGRMLSDGRIGRIAILKEFRGQGLGAKMMRALINTAQARGYSRVYLGAQTHAVDFYAKLGFTPYGEEFMDAGIPHLSMEYIVKAKE
ncbi:GNAT family N-acetyltransferase [Oceanisphaera avium]|uniref:GNAT family N-acetyltransferase n=1 Tax=Oceanisphaera avium TaxID=1903694 RepID=A0A1Y0D0S4_9GAMM|nr:GNAT family N-acetyltransferase [Oceanisphaera avium]ART80615.1 GNAT family N-acetyltransferase [Oceanisphaera avium]